MKYYGVAVGKSTGVFSVWSDVEPLVKGVKGAKYKSFPRKEEAEAYVKSGGVSNTEVKQGDSFIKNTGETCRVFALAKDQSEEGKFKICGVVGGFKETFEVNAWTWIEDYPHLSELDQQCYAYVHTIKRAIERGYKEIVVVYKNDCFMGWGTSWKPKSEAAQYYKNCLSIVKSRKDLTVHFEKYNKNDHYHLEYLSKGNLTKDNKSEDYREFGFTGNL